MTSISERHPNAWPSSRSLPIFTSMGSLARTSPTKVRSPSYGDMASPQYTDKAPTYEGASTACTVCTVFVWCVQHVQYVHCMYNMYSMYGVYMYINQNSRRGSKKDKQLKNNIGTYISWPKRCVHYRQSQMVRKRSTYTHNREIIACYLKLGAETDKCHNKSGCLITLHSNAASSFKYQRIE